MIRRKEQQDDNRICKRNADPQNMAKNYLT